MTVSICPKCQVRYVKDSMSGDYVHTCSDEMSSVLKNEDILVVGSWEDYTGSGTEPPIVNQERGRDTKLWGQRAWIEAEGKDRIVPDFTERGKSKNIYRARQHLEYIPSEK